MKIYILGSGSNTQLALGSARLAGADVLVVEKAGGITAAYPLTDKGDEDLKTLGLRSHRQGEYNTSFYPIPFVMYNAIAHLNSKFRLEWSNPPVNDKQTNEYRTGDFVVCPKELGYEILAVTDVRPINYQGKDLALHNQIVTAKTSHVALTPMSGHYFFMVLQK